MESQLIDKHRASLEPFGMLIGDKQAKLPTIYWLPKLHKNPYKFRFIANSSYCTTANLSKTLTSALSAIKQHVIKYCNTVYENNSKNLFWSIKNSSDVLEKLKLRRYEAGSISTYDFSTLYTTLPHHLIKKKLCELIQWTFGRENKLFIACNDYNTFFTSNPENNYTMWSCETVCDALCFLIDNIFIRNGHTVYRQVVGIPMGTNCAPLIADLFLFCYERDFMKSL